MSSTIALIDPRRLVVVGVTASSGGALGSPRGRFDGLIALIDPTTLKVSWTLRLGSAGNDALRAVAIVDGRAIVAVGQTDGGACRPRLGDADGWVVTVSLTGALLRSECVGTSTSDGLSDVAAAADGAVWVTGTTDAASPQRAGGRRAYHRAFASLVGPRVRPARCASCPARFERLRHRRGRRRQRLRGRGNNGGAVTSGTVDHGAPPDRRRLPRQPAARLDRPVRHGAAPLTPHSTARRADVTGLPERGPL